MNPRQFTSIAKTTAAFSVACLAHFAVPSASAATFYWDSTSPFSSSGFGNAAGTWAQNSTSGSGRWVTNSAGTVAGSGVQNTSGSDIFNFGTTANGLGEGTINVNGAVTMGNTNYASSSGSITLSGGTINYRSAVAVTVNNDANTIGSVIGGAATSFTKAGTGTLTLEAANSYTGTTIINNGTLALGASGSINSSSGVTLGGGTFDVSAKVGGYEISNLSGSGTVTGALTVSTQLSIGTTPGSSGFNSLTLAASSNYQLGLDGGGTDAGLGNVSGTLDLGGAVLDLVQLGTYTVDDKFTLFGYQAGTLAGTFAGLTNGDTFSDAGGMWQIDYDDATPGLNGGTGTSFVTITAVPEPSAALLGALGLLALLRRR